MHTDYETSLEDYLATGQRYLIDELPQTRVRRRSHQHEDQEYRELNFDE